MRFFIMLLTFAVALFAQVNRVVDCKTVLKNDPVPHDKYEDYVYNNIEENPKEYVCLYMLESCDDQDNFGWIAINKHRASYFAWNNSKNISVTLIRNNGLIDDTNIGGFVIEIDKYGIDNIHHMKRKEWFKFIDGVIEKDLSRADMCDEVQSTNKDVTSENCWGDPSGVGDVFCD